jgi:CubicO group peptidase (beta-lactamase class C family)
MEKTEMEALKREIRTGVTALVAMLLSHPVMAQSTANIESQVDAVFADWNKSDSPGCTCAAIKDGKILYAKGHGLAGLEHNAPLNADSVFYIASTTKQFTAAAVGLLVLDGKLSLQDDIRKYYPEFKNLSAVVTVEQLIHHTSGIRDYLELMSLMGRSETAKFDNAFVVKLIGRQKALNFVPGTQYLYSNSNYVLLADLVRRVSGKTLQEFARERIFTPLGMNATRFGDNLGEIIPNRVISYGSGPNGAVQFIKTIEAYGDGNLLTTANDLARWDENFYTGKVGGAALLELQKSVGVLASGVKTNYGLGLTYEQFRGQPAVSHSGGFQGFRTEMIRFPDQHLTVIALCNSGTINAAGLARRVATIYLAGQLGPPPAPPPPPVSRTEIKVDPSLYDRYVGDYALEVQPQFVLSFIREGDNFFIHPSGQNRSLIFPESETKFFSRMVDAQITFHREVDGSVNRLTLHQGGDREAKRVTKFTLEAKALNEYVGKYYSDELDVAYELVAQEGQLALLNPQGQPLILGASDRDRFNAGQGQLSFRRNASGKIDGVNYSGGRVRNMFFGRSP